jgi:hypothetical protein
MANPRERIAVWSAQPGPQHTLLQCTVPDIFYGGARGGGKTYGGIGKWIKHERKYGGRARGIVFRRTMPELEEFQRRCREIFPKLGWKYKVQARTWEAPSGASLKLRYLDSDADADNYQGHEYTFMLVEEMGNFPNPEPIDKLRACLRSVEGVQPEFIATGNPGGPGHAWIKKRYVDASEWGRAFYDDEARTYRIFIPARLEDNRLLTQNDPGYMDRLYAATVGRPWLRKNWLEGYWDAVPESQPFKQLHYYGSLPDNLKVFWVVDMAYTQKKTSDFTAGLLWGADSEWNLYELEYYEETATAAERLDYLFNKADYYQTAGHDVVLNLEAHPDWFAHILPQEMDLRRFDFAVNKLSPKGVSKDDRIRDNVSRWIDRLYFRPGSKLAQRVLNYQGGRDVNGEPDDGPDALAYLCMEADRAARIPPPEEKRDYVTAQKIQLIERRLHGPKTSFEVTR